MPFWAIERKLRIEKQGWEGARRAGQPNALAKNEWGRGGNQERLKNNSSEARSPGQLQWPLALIFHKKTFTRDTGKAGQQIFQNSS